MTETGMRGSGRGVRVAHGVAKGLLLACLACASSATLRSASGFREQNRHNLERLAIGMSREQVFAVMGTETVGRPFGAEGSGAVRTERDSLGVTQVQVPVGAWGPLLQNPHRTVTYLTEEHTWEVLFYYTHMVRDDDRIADDELSPVVLRNGLLVGIGREEWRAAAEEAGIEWE